jgi:hypothetical protein
MTWLTRLKNGLVLASAIALLANCSDDASNTKPKPSDGATTGYESYAIHVYASTKDGDVRIDFPPIEEVSAPKATVFGQTTPAASPGSKANVLVQVDGGTVELDPSGGNANYDVGWLLLLRAVGQCAKSGDSLVLGAPWKPTSPTAYYEYVFSTPAADQDCERMMRRQEILLCAADLLSEVASGKGIVDWPAPVGVTFPGDTPSYMTAAWKIPPQRNADKFIVRDLAINVLANMARLDLTTFSNLASGATVPATTCTDGYVQAASDTTYYNGKGTLLYAPFGSQKFEPVADPTVPGNAVPLAESRLRFKTHILRAGGRLLRELIDESVMADLAGGERQRGLSGDPKRGPELLWGQSTVSTQPYNSLTHAHRVMFGRWETGRMTGWSAPPIIANDAPLPSGDPRCGGWGPIELLTKGLGSGTSARWQDRQIGSGGQEKATNLIDRSGLVIPKQVLNVQPIGTVRIAVKAQLVKLAAKDAGIAVVTDPAFADRRSAIEAQVDKLTDADLRFGLDRAFDSYRLVTGESETVGTITQVAANLGVGGVKLVTSTDVASEVTALSGHVLDGGMPRRDIGANFAARLGPGGAASQCPDYQPAGVVEGSANMGKVSAFQDAFLLGDFFRRRLSTIRQATATGYPLTGSQFPTLADQASTELRTWTGPAYLVFRVEGTTLKVRILGLTPADLGVPTEADMKTRIVAVSGKPWVADCAAGIRKSCPANFTHATTGYVRAPTVEKNTPAEIPNFAQYTGGDERVFQLEFPLTPGTPTNWTPPTAISVGSPMTDFVYLVAKSDSADPNRGRVLAALTLRRDGEPWSYALISDYQQKLTNDVFGVGETYVAKPPNLGNPSASSPKTYCVEGAPRNFFVPLENELTSDSDTFESSWKHYLTLAKEASARADELGEKLIQLGLQQDERREAAGEELAQICGDFAALSELKVDKGQVKPTSNDQAINQCINEARHDVVFLSGKPPASVDSTVIKNSLLSCSSTGAGNGNCAKPTLDVGYLDFAPYYDPLITGGTATPTCDEAINTVTSISTSGKAFDPSPLQKLGAQVDAAGMGAVLNGLKLDVGEDLHFTATFENQIVMSTSVTAHWPACNATCGTATELREQLRKIFGQLSTTTASPTDYQNRDIALQRVTGALWMMAALSGQYPADHIKMWVPARNNMITTDAEPPPVLYGKAQFVDMGGGTTFRLTTAIEPSLGSVDDMDRSAMGDAKPIAKLYANAVQNTGRPAWVSQVYSRASLAAGGGATTTKYLHVQARNAMRVFPELASLGFFLSTQGQRLGGVSDFGGSCAPALDPEMTAAIAEIEKQRASRGGICTAPNGKFALVLPTPSGLQIRDIYGWYEGQFDVAHTDDIIFGAPDKGLGSLLYNSELIGQLGGGTGDSCIHGFQFGSQEVTGSCLANAYFNPIFPTAPLGHTRFTRSLLLPRACPPSNRAQLFFNSANPIPNGCEAAKLITRPLALTCVLGAGFTPLASGSLPPMTNPEDIVKLENWIQRQAENARVAVSRLVLQNVPKRVVEDYKSGSPGTGVFKGDHGQLVLQYREHLNTLATGWIEMSNQLELIRLAIQNARYGLELNNIASTIETKNLVMQEIGLHAALVKSTVKAAIGVVGVLSAQGAGALFDTADAGFDVGTLNEQIGIIEDLKKLNEAAKAIKALQVLVTLQSDTAEHYAALQKTLLAMQTAATQARATASALEQKENEAKYEAAKGSGADFVEINGKIVKFPVNTVLRRQYDLTKRRYEAALKDAKYLAYVARLAIEQRVGQRLDEIDEEIGPLQSPKTWADDLCSFQGVNYEALRNKAIPSADAGLTQTLVQVVAEFALEHSDPYIGDYVQKLEDFVEFYNIKYPSHEGDDVTVLSVRDDLLGPQGKCFRPARNLLFYSHNLERGDASATGVNGWQVAGCDGGDPKCLLVSPGLGLQYGAGALPPPGVASMEGYTWLRNVNPSELYNPGSTGVPEPLPGPPTNSVYQEVTLEAGSYALSWFDTARGVLPTDTPTVAGPDYVVGIYGPNWELIASHKSPAFVLQAGPPLKAWSDRRVIELAAKENGAYRVVFSASAPGSTLGSVAIANVQLEASSSKNTVTAYEATDGSLQVLSGDCVAQSPEQFRSAFSYQCNYKGCFHQLVQPFILDLKALANGSSALAGKIAQDNFNYRHVDIALNVVGSGVVDCSKNPTPSCFGSPYLEYTLEHDAFEAPIKDHWGEHRPFNFGSGAVHFGKALAAERFITLPVSSSDSAMLGQAAFTKVELRGRPLDGPYRLRVHDGPSLVWNKVEDIQVVLKYRYWSRIQLARGTR